MMKGTLINLIGAFELGCNNYSSYTATLNCLLLATMFYGGHDVHRGIIVLFGSWKLQATKLWNLWYLSHFTHTSLPTEGKRCNMSSVAAAYSGLAIAESFEFYRLCKAKSRFVP